MTALYYGRKVLGRAFLQVIPDKSMEAIEGAFRAAVSPGSTVWTDGNPSYNFFDSDPEFQHDKVIHRRGEFSKLRADGVKVSTNAVEGLFSRCKRFLRTYRACPRKQSHYGLFLGEFLWRSQHLPKDWRTSAFFEVLRVVRLQNKPKPEDTKFNFDMFEEPSTHERHPPKRFSDLGQSRKRLGEPAKTPRPWKPRK